MTEMEKEILVHVLTVECLLSLVFRIDADKVRKIEEEFRKAIETSEK